MLIYVMLYIDLIMHNNYKSFKTITCLKGQDLLIFY